MIRASYQFGVALAIDLIKRLIHCLMSFPLDCSQSNQADCQPGDPAHAGRRYQTERPKHSDWRGRRNQWSYLLQSLKAKLPYSTNILHEELDDRGQKAQLFISGPVNL